MKKLIISITIYCIPIYLFAQNGDTIEVQRTKQGKIFFAKFNVGKSRLMKEGPAFLKQTLKAKSDHEFRLKKETIDELGITHLRYDQYWKGIKIDNAEYLLHGKNGAIETMNGDFQDIDLTSVTPNLTEKASLAKAIAYVGAKKYKWEDPTMEKFIKERKNNINATYYPNGELVIAQDTKGGSNKFSLAWKFTISSSEPSNEQLIYVDANNGKIIADIPLICHANTICTAQTKYSGTQNITGDSYSGGYRLRETRNTTSGNTTTINTLNNQNLVYSNNSMVTEFSNTSSSYASGSWSTFNQDQQALDIHWGLEKVLDYWSTVMGRNSIDGNGLSLFSYVHATYPTQSGGLSPNNAAWNGTSLTMSYGDGDGFVFKPVVSLDVTAHELGHGICQFTAGLSGGYSESGALNEGLSDIWGAVIENWAAPTKQNWLMGEEIMANGYPCLRSLSNPKTGGYGNYPNTYQGLYWDVNNEPHQNSTVISHWFYLLCNGGNGINDNNQSISVPLPICIQSAANIVYRAEKNYLTSSSNYAAARNAMISAATDLYGATSNEVIQVTNAWYAVGVGASYIYNYPAISGADAVCSSSSYTIANMPSGYSIVSWSISPTSVASIPAGSAGSSVTVSKVSTGIATLSCIIKNSCNYSYTITKQIGVGTPAAPAFEVYLIDPAIGRIQLRGPVPGATSYNWYKNGVLNTSYHSEFAQIPITKNVCDVYYDISQAVVNPCGTSAQAHINVYVPPADCGNARKQNPESTEEDLNTSVTIFPNPANSGLVTITNTDENAYTALFKDVTGKSYLKVALSKDKQNVDISSLPAGTYFVEVQGSTSHKTLKFIKQ